MNVLCSGNPLHNVLASEVAKRFPGANFVSRTNGYDLKHWTLEIQQKFKKILKESNVFINSSYIAPGVQQRLLETAVAEWMQADIKGHVISLGTTAEYDESPIHLEYKKSKKELRNSSLEFNTKTGITGVKTSYIIVSGIKSGTEYCDDFLELYSVVDAIEWTINNPNQIPLLQIEPSKIIRV